MIKIKQTHLQKQITTYRIVSYTAGTVSVDSIANDNCGELPIHSVQNIKFIYKFTSHYIIARIANCVTVITV